MDLSEFHGPNAAYLVELYDRYRQNPDAVDAATRALFEGWAPPEAPARAAPAAADTVMRAVNLAQAVREYGHTAARLDPLGSPPPGDPALTLAFHGLSEGDLRGLPASLIGGPIAGRAAHAAEAVEQLRAVYSAAIGYDYDHLRDPTERAWLRDAAERGTYRPSADTFDPAAMLARLTQVEVFEQFLHRLFPGKYRFSIEGLDMLVPMLDEIICDAVGAGAERLLIGMAHRGRLNVMAHVLDKPYRAIMAEFKDPLRLNWFERELGWTGDVKYHKGARSQLDGQREALTITLPPNPSHLEAIYPVLEGMARAAGTRVDEGGPPTVQPASTLPVLIHGDAAFSAQGVVAETLNLSRLPGYWTGGTIHIIANNQLGFTTLPEAGRSTLYASDVAKGYKIPVVHVNADDPEACVEAARLAIAYRTRFQKDFLIDLIGYRRYGHNEGDEPGFTQPRMYAAIRQHPTVREQWAGRLVSSGVLAEGEPEALVGEWMQRLQAELESLEPEEDIEEARPEPPPPGAAREVATAVDLERLRALNTALMTLPEGFRPHPKLRRAMESRRAVLDDPAEASVDWATAEDLALAAILADGTAIRFTGQDSQRGTFSHRHAVFHDAETGDTFTPLAALPQARAAFEIHDSPLSENAALGFEYGYNIQRPERLVIWEAQYGDFVNNAQLVIDEFITSARAKWGQTPSLVLLLPHGWEGAGPDHSSGRLERFLSLAAQTNLRVANATTAAQYFHLLRRQARLLTSDPLPLIVMTPKSLLRHPLTRSAPRALSEGGWQPVLDDERAQGRPAGVTSVVLCSGKFAVDLLTSDHRDDAPHVAVVRVEQLYPFPEEEISAVLGGYPALERVTWAQEEPGNMGALPFVRPRLRALLDGRWPLAEVARARNASPAEGSAAGHQANQRVLIRAAFGLPEKPVKPAREARPAE